MAAQSRAAWVTPASVPRPQLWTVSSLGLQTRGGWNPLTPHTVLGLGDLVHRWAETEAHSRGGPGGGSVPGLQRQRDSESPPPGQEGVEVFWGVWGSLGSVTQE